MPELSTERTKPVTNQGVYRRNAGYPEATPKTIYFAPAVF